jgi:long-subunit fatty acid transport protein
VSLEVEVMKNLNLAVDYKHKASQDLTGDVRWSGVSPVIGAATPTGPLAALFPLKVATSTTSASQNLTIPNTLNIGAAYRPVKPLLVTGTFTFDRWVVYDQDQFIGETGFVLTVPRHYRNGQTYRAGVAYDVLPILTVRAGAQRDVSGLRKEFYSPTLPDASSWGGSLGATVRFAKGFSVDAAGFYARMDKATATNPGVEPGVYASAPTTPVVLPTGTFRGSYQPSAWVFSASVNWQPQSM